MGVGIDDTTIPLETRNLGTRLSVHPSPNIPYVHMWCSGDSELLLVWVQFPLFTDRNFFCIFCHLSC